MRETRKLLTKKGGPKRTRKHFRLTKKAGLEKKKPKKFVTIKLGLKASQKPDYKQLENICDGKKDGIELVQ